MQYNLEEIKDVRAVVISGHITIQRKGGDGGRDTANMLQFKIDPTDLFDI